MLSSSWTRTRRVFQAHHQSRRRFSLRLINVQFLWPTSHLPELILSGASPASAEAENDFTPQKSTADGSVFFETARDLVPDLPFQRVASLEVPAEGQASLP